MSCWTYHNWQNWLLNKIGSFNFVEKMRPALRGMSSFCYSQHEKRNVCWKQLIFGLGFWYSVLLQFFGDCRCFPVRMLRQASVLLSYTITWCFSTVLLTVALSVLLLWISVKPINNLNSFTHLLTFIIIFMRRWSFLWIS